ncbi:MAG: hypothetical protein OXC95_11185 [Dehalococcoidia bacterium]|nr:hypothetical protein [Dehalococcoidia bacterium]
METVRNRRAWSSARRTPGVVAIAPLSGMNVIALFLAFGRKVGWAEQWQVTGPSRAAGAYCGRRQPVNGAAR